MTDSSHRSPVGTIRAVIVSPLSLMLQYRNMKCLLVGSASGLVWEDGIKGPLLLTEGSVKSQSILTKG